MTKTKTRKRPKSRQRHRRVKKQMAKAFKVMLKKNSPPSITAKADDDPGFLDIIKGTPAGLRTYDPNDPSFSGVHPYNHTLQDFEWLGLLTLKFHSQSHSKDDAKGDGRKNRVEFLAAFMENLRRKLGLSDREFNWFACEEFGFTGDGHLHVLISLDYLKEKGRMDRLKITDFSENGHFFQEGLESVGFIARKLHLNPRSVDFHWRPMWENVGLVSYFCKIEFGHEDKFFNFSKYWEKRGLLKAA